MTRIIDELLVENGVSNNHGGYFYFHTAVLMALREPKLLWRITQSLYPAVAEKYGTTPAGVERAMSHALKSAWTSEKCAVRSLVKTKPTNRVFIAYLADQTCCRMRAIIEEQDREKNSKNKHI